jgi:hypothetical protein
MRNATACLLGGASIVAAGCASLGPTVDPSRPTALMQERDARMSALEMRQRVDALVPSMLSFVEETTDRVRSETSDPAIRRRALLLKIDALPVVYRAAFQTDPLAAALDLWLLSYQLENCLEEGIGPCDFGPQQPIAREAARAQREELDGLFAKVSANPEATVRDRELVRSTALRYPLEDEASIRRRRTMTEELLKAMDVEGIGAFDVIGDVSTTLANLTTRLNLYLGDATRLGRWQAELLVGDLAEDLARRAETGDVLTNLDRVTDSVESAARTLEIESLNALMDRPLDLVRDERQALLADIDRQRVLTLEYLTGERQATVDALLEGVRAERVATLAQIRQERLETLEEIERLRRDTLTDGGAVGVRLVDHLVWRLAQLVVGLLLLATLLAWLVLRTARREGHT